MMSLKLSWSQESYGLKEFAEFYKYQLPVIIKVTQGYCGIDESKYTFSMDEIYHVSHINSQRRVIAKDSNGRMLSIPEDYPVQFTRKGSSARPQRFQEMFQGKPFEPGIKVIPIEETKLSFFIGADKKMKTGIERLELVDRFQDQYLVGNPIVNGQMQDDVFAIPLFIGIKIVVAEGVKTGTEAEYRKMLAQYKSESQKFKNETVAGNPEIMLYENDNQQEGGEYAFLEPKTYISCAELAALKQQYQPLAIGPPGTSAESESGNLYTDVIDTIKPPKPAKKPTARGAISLDTSQVTAHKDSDATCFKTLEQVPKDLQGVSTDGVADCLKLIKMEKHVKMFMENDIDGALLVALDLSTLSGDLGMSSLEAKKLHMFVHQGWRPKKN